jgi:CDP-diacylglycerol--glycerol-3-phosphate 3-phosphatidyltransferase
MVNTTNQPKETLTEWMRKRSRGILEPIAGFFIKIGLMPNTMTILGLVGNIAGALFLARGQMFWGGILILLMGPVDALDGTMARLKGMPTKFGGFVDSVTDRYSELIIFGGLLFYYYQEQNLVGTLLVYLAACGSILVSYIRARGQSLGWDTKVGILTRMERYLVMVPSLILNFPLVGLVIIALFANFTAIQRIVDIRRQALRPDHENGKYY